MRRRRFWILAAALAALLLAGSWTVLTGANTVPTTSLYRTLRAVNKPVDLKPPECSGLTPTSIFQGGGTLTGTAGSDLILGSAGNDTLSGRGGNDCLVGGAGTDTLNGGTGTDVCIGRSTATYNGCETIVFRP